MSQQNSRFFRLPGELRNEIYTLAFEGTHHKPRGSTRPRVQVSKRAPVALLLSCRRIYQEAKGIHYSTTTFVIEATPSATQWLTALPRETLAQILDVHLASSGWSRGSQIHGRPKKRHLACELLVCCAAAVRIQEIHGATGIDKKYLKCKIMDSIENSEWIADPEAKYEELVLEWNGPESMRTRLRGFLQHALSHPGTWQQDLEDEFTERGVLTRYH